MVLDAHADLSAWKASRYHRRGQSAGALLHAGAWDMGEPSRLSRAPRSRPASAESGSSRKTIQHLEGGIIRKRSLVSDGDIVRSGQTLIELDDTRAGSERCSNT